VPWPYPPPLWPDRSSARSNPGVEQGSIASFVGSSLDCARLCGGYGSVLRRDSEREVGAVDPHEGLSAPHEVAGVDHALDYFAGDSKAEIALHSRHNNSGIRALR